MSIVESQGYRTVTEASAFDYGASGRGGWDERPPKLVSHRKRPKKERVFEDAGVYLSRASLQGRCAADLSGVFPTSDEWRAVYLVMNVRSRDFYIGCSEKVIERWRTHTRLMKQGKHPLQAMNELCAAHGLASFRFLVLEVVTTRRLLDVEAEWIKGLRPTLNPLPHWLRRGR